MPDEQPKPWERQPWDTMASFAAFREYYLPQERKHRNVSQAYRDYRLKQGKSSVKKNGSPVQAGTSWRSWSMGLNYSGKKPVGTVFENSLTWEQRAAAWDAEKDREWDQKWSERRKLVRDSEFETHEALIERAKRMMTASLFRRTVESADGRSVTVIEPTDWGEQDIARLFDLAYKLGRRSAEMETERIVTVDWRTELENAGVEPDLAYQKLVDSIAEALAEGRSPHAGAGNG